MLEQHRYFQHFKLDLSHLSAVLIAIVFFAIWLLLWLPIAYPIALKVSWRPFRPSSPTQKIALLLPLYGIAPLLLFGWIRLTGTSWRIYGLLWPQLLRSFGYGLAIGTLSLLLLVAIQYGLGWISHELTDPDGDPTAAPWTNRLMIVGLLLILAVWVSWTEELVFRGFLQTQLQQAWTAWEAAAIASSIFAILHGLWEGKAVLPQLPGLWLMGMVLVLARNLDQDGLGLAWGLHAGWVWTIASLDSLGWMKFTSQAPAWFTGMNQQPIAGVLSWLFFGSTAVGLWLLQG